MKTCPTSSSQTTNHWRNRSRCAALSVLAVFLVSLVIADSSAVCLSAKSGTFRRNQLSFLRIEAFPPSSSSKNVNLLGKSEFFRDSRSRHHSQSPLWMQNSGSNYGLNKEADFSSWKDRVSKEYNLPDSLIEVLKLFKFLPGGSRERSKYLVSFGQRLPKMDQRNKHKSNQVKGCMSLVNLHPVLKLEGKAEPFVKRLHWEGDSDGLLTKGLVHLLIRGLNGCSPEEILKLNPNFLAESGIQSFLATSRINGFLNMVKTMQHQAHMLEHLRKAEDGRYSIADNVNEPMKSFTLPYDD